MGNSSDFPQNPGRGGELARGETPDGNTVVDFPFILLAICVASIFPAGAKLLIGRSGRTGSDWKLSWSIFPEQQPGDQIVLIAQTYKLMSIEWFEFSKQFPAYLEGGHLYSQCYSR